MPRKRQHPRPWHRALWGVTVRSDKTPQARPLLIGGAWDQYPRAGYVGEPARALLFTTRAHARQWCREQEAGYASRPAGDPCRAWRFRPVKAIESVTPTTRTR